MHCILGTSSSSYVDCSHQHLSNSSRKSTEKLVEVTEDAVNNLWVFYMHNELPHPCYLSVFSFNERKLREQEIKKLGEGHLNWNWTVLKINPAGGLKIRNETKLMNINQHFSWATRDFEFLTFQTPAAESPRRLAVLSIGPLEIRSLLSTIN